MWPRIRSTASRRGPAWPSSTSTSSGGASSPSTSVTAVRDAVDVLGIPFDRLDLRSASARIFERLDAGRRTFVITANPEFVMLARQDAALAQIAREADLIVADGTGIIVGSRILGDALARVPGRLLVDGLARVKTAAPDVLLVAYGMPRQERWIARNLPRLPSVKLAIGVGGVFDQLAGKQRVPPAFLHRLGLEWLWRLVLEPSRWRRQRVLPVFATLILRRRITGK